MDNKENEGRGEESIISKNITIFFFDKKHLGVENSLAIIHKSVSTSSGNSTYNVRTRWVLESRLRQICAAAGSS
jgi:hypothetical protein